MNFSTPLARLRLMGLIEGTSCVLLFFVAMPLKYLADQSWAVTVVGSAHGALWVTYLLAVANVWRARKWPADRVIVAGLVSIPPIGTFIFDRSLKREQRAIGDQPTATAPAVESGSLK
jgi:integral membrane protein